MIRPRWDWLSFRGRIARLPYLATGLGLTLLKMAIDAAVVGGVFRREWSPRLDAWIGEVVWIFSLDPGDRASYLTMAAVALPFVTIGLVLTVRRLRDAGWPIWIACLFFAPMPINLVFLLVVGLVPGAPERPKDEEFARFDDLMDVPPEAKGTKGLRPAEGAGGPWLARAIGAVLIPLPAAGVAVYWMAQIHRDYGLGLFIGMPLVMPMISVVLFGYRRRPTWGQCLGVGQLWLLVASLTMLATAFEGMICIVMALPLAVPIVLLGSTLGYLIVGLPPRRPPELGRMLAALLATLPMMAGAEHLQALKPPLFECETSVEVDAPPEVVWRRVVSFPDLPPPRDLLSRSGVAYPIRARIEGAGVGAVRHCEFSTGAFVEPIEVWDEPRLLRFAVTSCPSPMREWNPFFEVHPPHLDGFFVSKRGQFRLLGLPGGRTRLEGTTWYRHGLWPVSYWRAWSDPIIHGIHARVLGHVKALAEADSGRH